jgi:hypothetical protein
VVNLLTTSVVQLISAVLVTLADAVAVPEAVVELAQPEEDDDDDDDDDDEA